MYDCVAQHDHEIFVIGLRLVRILDDQRAAQTLLLLQTEVRVVPKGARLLEVELVIKVVTRPDRRLGDVGHAVLQVGVDEAVPMQAGRLVQEILDENPEPIAPAVANGSCPAERRSRAEL